MAIRYYVSTEEASFFNNNRMGYANSIPTEGNYKVGDFIISSTQENGIFGWVCTVAGNPGEWEVIGSGMNNGSDPMHDKLVGYVNAVSFSDTRSSVEIGINEYKKGIDFLEVHYNGLMLAEGVHYNVSADGKSIVAIDDVWNENADDTQQMIFRVLKSEGVNVKELRNVIDINSACYEVEMGIEGFNPEKDVVEIHLNGVLLVQGVDYEIVEGRISKLDRSEAWNPYNVNGQKMFVKVFRNNANLVEPEDGSVSMDKLADDIREDLAAIDGLVATVGIQNNTISNINDRVSAIEEKIENGDIATNGGGGPVKLSYKDNLVEVVNTNTVAIGLPFNKEKDMLEVHIDGLKLAEGVHYNISEDGTSIVKVEGVWNPDSLDDQYIDFRVITAGNQQIDHLTRNVEFSSPMTEVGIELEYEHGVDILIVHLNGIKLVEGLDFEYVAEGNKIVKIDANEPWNLYGVDGQLFVIDVLRNVGKKVTMDGLADDVKQAIEAAGNIDITGKQDATDNNLATTDKTIVGAINELFQSANNGKELIASAIGEPLSSEDTFSAMSNDIIGLLNTFKTNMMNNGITVESGDKFKSLIDKIATMVEEGSGKGIQYVEGTIESAESSTYVFTTVGGDTKSQNYAIIRDLPFKPTILILDAYDNVSGRTWTSVLSYDSSLSMNTVKMCIFGEYSETTTSYHFKANNKVLTNDYIRMPIWGNKDELTFKYYAVGVGEEDTTLRDSLADILENKGVDVTEEDDMASLITKVEGLVEIPGFIKQGCWMIAPIASNPNKAYFESTMVAIGNNIYVMGGKSASNGYYGTDNHYAYNVKTDTWVERAKLPAVRKSSISIAVDDGIYNTGGTGDGYNGQKTTYYYDSISNSWTTKAAMPDFKYNHAFTSFDNKLFITGGTDSVDNYGDKTFIYDILTNTWTQKEDYPDNTDRHHALTIDSDRILVFTGGSYDYYYIPSTDTWTQVNYSGGTGNVRSRIVFSSKTGKAYFANASNMVSMDFSNINKPTVEVISICHLENSFGDVVEVDGNIYHMYGSDDDNTVIIGIL